MERHFGCKDPNWIHLNCKPTCKTHEPQKQWKNKQDYRGGLTVANLFSSSIWLQRRKSYCFHVHSYVHPDTFSSTLPYNKCQFSWMSFSPLCWRKVSGILPLKGAALPVAKWCVAHRRTVTSSNQRFILLRQGREAFQNRLRCPLGHVETSLGKSAVAIMQCRMPC